MRFWIYHGVEKQKRFIAHSASQHVGFLRHDASRLEIWRSVRALATTRALFDIWLILEGRFPNIALKKRLF